MGVTSQNKRRWHHLVPLSLTYALAFVGAVSAAWSCGARSLELALGIVVGVILWTFWEYASHRWMQHGPNLAWRINDHEHHHRFPEDVVYLVMPLNKSLRVAVVLATLAAAGPWRSSGLAVFAGFVIGYITYEWVHLGAHSPELVARHRWLQRIIRNHYRHHFSSARRHYGFITTFWDVLLRTR